MKDFKLKYSWKYLLPVCLFGWVGCTSDTEDSPSDNQTTGLPICWNVQSEKAKDSRALIDNSTVLQTACSTGGQAIGIWSAYERGGQLTQNALGTTGDASLVYQSGNTYEWTYGEVAYWKRKAVYYFNAYFPKESPEANGMTNLTHSTTQMGVKYNTLATQQDLMVCRVSVDTGAEGFQGSPVSLDMKHALSSLKFTFQMEEGADISKKIKSLSLDNTLAVSGTLEYQTGAVAISNWKNLSFADEAIYVWSNEGVSFSADASASAYTTPQGTTTTAGGLYCNNNGHVLIIPQKCDVAPCITIVTDTDRYENVSLGTTQFEPGKHYVYNIVIKDNRVEITLGIKAWNLKESSYDITF